MQIKRETRPIEKVKRARGRPIGGVVADDDLARRVARWLRLKRLSYARAGLLLGVHGSTVQRWVSGDARPSSEMRELIEKVLEG